MPNNKTKALVQLLESHNIPVIEDDVYGDLYFTENRGIPAQFTPKKVWYLTCSSFSKTAATGAIFLARKKFKNFILLSYGLPWTNEIEYAIDVLGELVRKLQASISGSN